MSERFSAGVEDQPIERDEVPVIDVAKLESLVASGDVPATVLGLYEEMHTEGAQKPFISTFEEAGREQQEKILRALQRASDKIEALPSETADAKLKLSLMTLIAFFYTMFLTKMMMSGITRDKTLDPGKNEEGALLNILELNGKEVFVHPEKFEITDFKGFLLKIIHAGHGREVLEHIRDIAPSYHSHIVFECLQVSRQKKGVLEAAYVIDALPACKELGLEVAQQLCRLGFDHLVVEYLSTYSNESLQDVVLLLFKSKKLTIREVFTQVLDLPEALLVKQAVISACYLEKKMYAALQLPENSDVLQAIERKIPNVRPQVAFLRSAVKGNRETAVRIEILPDLKTAKALVDKFGVHDLDFLSGLDRIEAKVLESLIRMYPWESIRFNFLQELSDEAADSLSSVPLQTNVSVSVGPRTAMSAEAAEYFRARRGWFVFPNTVEGKVTVQSDGFARTVATGSVKGAFFEDLQTLGVVSARLLAKNHHETLYLDGLRTLSKDVAKELSVHEKGISFNGLERLKEGESFDPVVAALLLRCAEGATEIGPGMLQGALQQAALRVNEHLKFLQLESLSSETARLLSEYPGSIYLPAVRVLSRGEAENLSAHQGNVLFLGIKTISKDVAAALARHKGKHLSFLSLEELSDEAAVALAKYPGVLHFPSLIEASLEARVALSRHQEEITLSEDFDRGDPAEDPFFQVRGWYPQKKVCSDMTAQTFASKGSIEKDIPLPHSFLERIGNNFRAEHKVFYLDARTSLTNEELEWIAGFEGTITLRGIKSIGRREAAYFNRALASIVFDPNVAIDKQTYYQMEEYWDNQFTDHALTFIPFAVLKHRFAGHRTAPLEFPEVESMDDELAKALEGYEGDISLDSVTKISVEALVSLAKTRGKLSLNGLKDFPKEAIPFFRAREGKISLRGLTYLSEEVAQLLVDQDQELWFDEIQQLSASVIRILAKNKKDIHFLKVKKMHGEDMKLFMGVPWRTIFLDNLTFIEGGRYLEVIRDPSFSLEKYMNLYQPNQGGHLISLAGGGKRSNGTGEKKRPT